jgi:hypothetical protein
VEQIGAPGLVGDITAGEHADGAGEQKAGDGAARSRHRHVMERHKSGDGKFPEAAPRRRENAEEQEEIEDRRRGEDLAKHLARGQLRVRRALFRMLPLGGSVVPEPPHWAPTARVTATPVRT